MNGNVVELVVRCIGPFSPKCSRKNNTNNLEALFTFLVLPTATYVEKIVLRFCMEVRGRCRCIRRCSRGRTNFAARPREERRGKGGS